MAFSFFSQCCVKRARSVNDNKASHGENKSRNSESVQRARKGQRRQCISKEWGQKSPKIRPSYCLSKTELEKRVEKTRESVNKHRESRRRRANEEPTTSNSRLVVKIDFNKGGKKTPTSIRARKKFASLEERISHLEIANKRVSKRYERFVKGASTKRSKNADEITPKSRTNKQLREAGLNIKRADESLKRRLLFSNVLVDEIRESAQENKNCRQASNS